MNAIRQTALLNKRELENAIPPSASWHVDYRDTAWVYVGGLPLDLSEGDVVTIFSQFGSPTHLNLIRDKETGKSKGFGFLKYEDQRSCDLAVDNLGGADVLGRLLRVDHTRYNKKKDEDEQTYRIDRLEAGANGNGNGKRASDTESEDEGRGKRRKMLREESELEDMLAIRQDGEDEDPMRDYLVKEKRDEVERAREREKRHKHKHRHRHRHRHHHRGEGEGGDVENRHRHKHRQRDRSRSDDRNGEPSHRHRADDEERRRHRRERDQAKDPERRSRSRSHERSQRHHRDRDSKSPLRSDDKYRPRRHSRSPEASES